MPSRIHRLLRMLTLIQGQKGWNAERLAQELGKSPRTIYRDLQALQDAGIPYFHDHEADGYQIGLDFFLPPLQLTLDESLALVALAEQVGETEQIPFTKPAARAIEKIRGQLPQSIRHELEQIEDHLTIKLAQSMPPEGVSDVYDDVQKALTTRRVLRCRYDSAKSGSDGETFRFKPYTLFFCQRAWYVVGYHERRKEVRCLKLNRFIELKVTATPYAIPSRFSLAKHLGNAWRMIKGDRSYAVKLHFDAEFADTLADTQWHPTQKIKWNPDDSIIFECTVDGLDEIVWWVLSMGPHCVVEEPVELARRVSDLAQQIVAKYAPPAAEKSVAITASTP